MKKIELEVVALSHTITQSQSYAVVLGEKEGVRRLPIVIGAYEAQAIAVAMENVTPPRPLTHDLLKNVCHEFGIELKEVIISNLLNGIFYATLVCQNNGEVLEIDSRTSDGLALAFRFNCPIYTYEFILDQAGIIMEDVGQEKEKKVPAEKKKPSDFAKHSVDKLTTLLEEAISQENYETAAKLRDEIEKRAAS